MKTKNNWSINRNLLREKVPQAARSRSGAALLQEVAVGTRNALEGCR